MYPSHSKKKKKGTRRISLFSLYETADAVMGNSHQRSKWLDELHYHHLNIYIQNAKRLRMHIDPEVIASWNDEQLLDAIKWQNHQLNKFKNRRRYSIRPQAPTFYTRTSYGDPIVGSIPTTPRQVGFVVPAAEEEEQQSEEFEIPITRSRSSAVLEGIVPTYQDCKAAFMNYSGEEGNFCVSLFQSPELLQQCQTETDIKKKVRCMFENYHYWL